MTKLLIFKITEVHSKEILVFHIISVYIYTDIYIIYTICIPNYNFKFYILKYTLNIKFSASKYTRMLEALKTVRTL